MANCPICGREREEITRRTVVGNKATPTYRCGSCDLWFLDPEAYSGKLYDTDRLRLPEGAGSEQRDFSTYLKAARLKKGMRIIDIGCGDGGLLREASKRGISIIGSELYESEKTRRLRKEGFQIVCGDISQLMLEPFDAVFMSHVIEHLPEPDAFLKQVRRLLKDNGLLYVVTPNYSALVSRIMSSSLLVERIYANDPYRRLKVVNGVADVRPRESDQASMNWFRVLEFEHTLQFTKKSLLLLMRKNGFRMEKRFTGNSIMLLDERLTPRNVIKRLILGRALNSMLRLFNLQAELFISFRKSRPG